MGFHRWYVCLVVHRVRRRTKEAVALVRIPCNHGSTKQFRSAYKEVEITRLHQQIRFYISFAYVNNTG